MLDDEYRLNVWSQFAKCQIWLEHIGIYHEDIVEHNVMVSPAPLPTLAGSGRPITHPRAVLIDFGEADVEDPGHDTANLPEDPIAHYWSALSGLGSWCPKWFVGNTPERRKWMMVRYSQCPRYQMVDPSLDPDHLDSGENIYMEIHGYK